MKTNKAKQKNNTTQKNLFERMSLQWRSLRLAV